MDNIHLEGLILYEEMLEFQKDLEMVEKFSTFADRRADYESSILFEELNQNTNEITDTADTATK